MREWKTRHHNAGVENGREASMESHTLTTQDVTYFMFQEEAQLTQGHRVSTLLVEML